MIKDAVGNEIKVGDKILVPVQGMSVVEVMAISEGGLAVHIPGMNNVVTKGMLKIRLEQEVAFEPMQKQLPFYKINIPVTEEEKEKENKEKKEHGPN